MRDAAGESADRLHLGGLAQLCLERHALTLLAFADRDVADQRDDAAVGRHTTHDLEIACLVAAGPLALALGVAAAIGQRRQSGGRDGLIGPRAGEPTARPVGVQDLARRVGDMQPLIDQIERDQRLAVALVEEGERRQVRQRPGKGDIGLGPRPQPIA